MTRFVDELEAIRAALGIKRWHVAGHCWGGTVALEYAARRPAALAGVVLASTSVSTNSWIADANMLRTRLAPITQKLLKQCETMAASARRHATGRPRPFTRCSIAAPRSSRRPPGRRATPTITDRTQSFTIICGGAS